MSSRPALTRSAGAVPGCSSGLESAALSVNKQQTLPHLKNQQVKENPPPLDFDPETGEIRTQEWSYSATLVERYALQAQARRAMLERWHRDGREGKAHRVTVCRRWLAPRGEGRAPYAEVHRHTDTGRAFFSGVHICGSPWACTCCGPKISERRAEEIRAAVDQWIAKGGICLFVTLTVPHTREDAIAGMVRRFRDALRRFRGGRAAVADQSLMGFAGLVRALEVTWGELNGWHPHTHEIWFIEAGHPVPVDSIVSRWQAAAVAAGFERPSDQHGVVFRPCSSTEQAAQALAEYLAKLGQGDSKDTPRPTWGPAQELAKAHSKRGRLRRMTPWDFLRAQYDPEQTPVQRARFRALFADYVEAFKGSAQIWWTPKFKARFDLADLDDEEIAQESREAADSLARIEADQWERVVCAREDHRPTVLLVAQYGGADALREFIAALPPADSS